MSKLPVISGGQLVRALGKAGFIEDRQKGSHVILYRANPPTPFSVPDPRGLDCGTLRAILRQAGLSPAELESLL